MTRLRGKRRYTHNIPVLSLTRLRDKRRDTHTILVLSLTRLKDKRRDTHTISVLSLTRLKNKRRDTHTIPELSGFFLWLWLPVRLAVSQTGMTFYCIVFEQLVWSNVVLPILTLDL